MGGGDKCLSLLGGQSILARIIETFSPQVSALLLNANGDSDRFSNFELPILPDSVGDYAGPLAGILTSMRWAEGFDFDWLVTVAGDAPFIPEKKSSPSRALICIFITLMGSLIGLTTVLLRKYFFSS